MSQIDLSQFDRKRLGSIPLDAKIKGIDKANLLVAEKARKDPNIFCRYVLRDEETGQRVQQSDVHVRMQKIVTKYNRAVVLAMIESGKSNQITIGRTLWQLGQNPRMRGAIISNTEGQASKFLRSASNYIADSPEFHYTFPDVRKGEPWQATRIHVRRGMIAPPKDPSIQAFGVHGQILSARLDYVVCDDLLDHENTRTKAQRDDVFDWFFASVMGRLTREAKVVVVSTAWHVQDLVQRLTKRKGWHYIKIPALDKKKKPTYPERWSQKRIDRAKIEDFTDIEFNRQLMVEPRDDSESAFKQEYIERGLKEGSGRSLMRTRDEFEKFMRRLNYGPDPVRDGSGQFAGKPMEQAPIICGVDLAAKRTKRAAKTCLFTLALLPANVRQILWVESGKWDGPVIVQRILDHYERYGCIFWVENNATQEWILQFTAEKDAVPMYPFTTGRNKANPQFGVESLALEMHQGKWAIPNRRGKCDAEIEEWTTNLRYHDPNEHSEDNVMASWFAREGLRRLGKRRRPRVGVKVLG